MDIQKYCDAQKIAQDIDTMNAFGVRLTGTDAQNEFCKWIKAQISDMGYEAKIKEHMKRIKKEADE